MVSDESVPQGPKSFLLVVTLPDGGKEHHHLDGREITVGRDPSNHIRLSHHFVSQFHAKFVRTGSSLSVVDLGSANKTRVNGREIVQKDLKEGDAIEIAGLKCQLVFEGQPKTPGLSNTSESPPVSVQSEPISSEAPVSKVYLSIGVVLLFAAVVALAMQVCR